MTDGGLQARYLAPIQTRPFARCICYRLIYLDDQGVWRHDATKRRACSPTTVQVAKPVTDATNEHPRFIH